MNNYRKRKILFPLFLISCFFSCQNEISKEKPFPKATIEQRPRNTLSQKEIAIGWELLFDGKKMNHWKNYNSGSLSNEDWKIDDDGILLSGKTDIISKRKFENFEFKIDYQLSEGSNSGIYYRVIEAEAYPIWFNAPEYTLLDDAHYLKSSSNHPNVKKHLNSGIFDVYEPTENLTHPIGEWNQVRLVVHSGFVEHWLNGVRVVEYQINSTDWKNRVKESKFKSYLNYGKAKLGHLGLQGNESPVKFRNIKIREL